MTDKRMPREKFWLTRAGAVLLVFVSPISALIFPGPGDPLSYAAVRWGIFFIVLAGIVWGIFLLTRQITIECPGCKKPISSDEPWVCPQPNCRGPVNDKTTLFSFLGICQSCFKAPTAFSCYHDIKENVPCDSLIYLSREKDCRWTATSLMKVEPPKPTLDDKVVDLSKKVRVSKVEKEFADAEVERMRAEAQKKVVEESLNPKNKPEPQPKEVRMKADLNRRLVDGAGAHKIAEEARRQIATDYADDPNQKERLETIIEDWLDEQTLK